MTSPESLEQRVIKEADGTYTWHCRIDYDYFKKSMKLGIVTCILISISILIMGLVFSYMARDWSSVLPVVLADVIFIIIFVSIFGFVLHVSKDPWEVYKMSDEYVKSGSGKSSVYFYFNKAQTVLMGDRFIELKGKYKRFRMYFPAEDKSFIRGFVTRHIPLEALVTYDEEAL